MFNYDKVDQPIKIKVVGLFGRYEEIFEIIPIATLQTQIIQPPLLKTKKLAIAEIEKSICQFNVDRIQFSFINTNFITKIKSPDIILPTFKKDNYHE